LASEKERAEPHSEQRGYLEVEQRGVGEPATAAAAVGAPAARGGAARVHDENPSAPARRARRGAGEGGARRPKRTPETRRGRRPGRSLGVGDDGVRVRVRGTEGEGGGGGGRRWGGGVVVTWWGEVVEGGMALAWP
jgi:hypothetical protein